MIPNSLLYYIRATDSIRLFRKNKANGLLKRHISEKTGIIFKRMLLHVCGLYS